MAAAEEALYVFSNFTVKAGTLMQLHPKEISQLQHMTAFAALINNKTRAGMCWHVLARMWAELWHHSGI